MTLAIEVGSHESKDVLECLQINPIKQTSSAAPFRKGRRTLFLSAKSYASFLKSFPVKP